MKRVKKFVSILLVSCFIMILSPAVSYASQTAHEYISYATEYVEKVSENTEPEIQTRGPGFIVGAVIIIIIITSGTLH